MQNYLTSGWVLRIGNLNTENMTQHWVTEVKACWKLAVCELNFFFYMLFLLQANNKNKMQILVLSMLCLTLLTNGVDADVKKCQDIKNKFLACTTKWVLFRYKPTLSLDNWTWHDGRLAVYENVFKFKVKTIYHTILARQGTWDVQGANCCWERWPTWLCCEEGMQLHGDRHSGLSHTSLKLINNGLWLFFIYLSMWFMEKL